MRRTLHMFAVACRVPVLSLLVLKGDWGSGSLYNPPIYPYNSSYFHSLDPKSYSNPYINCPTRP